MRACIDYAVFVKIVGQVGFPAAGIAGIKGKLQNFHIGIAGVAHQLPDGFRDISQVLRDDGQAGDFFFNGPEEADPRSFLPLSDPCIRAVRGDRVILVKTAEMVDPDDVKQAAAPAHPADPPGIAGIPVVLPVVEGISPELAGRGKSVRRASGDRLAGAVLMQLEELRVGPDLRAVRWHIDRDISDDGDSLPVGIGLERRPLPLELILEEALEFDLLRELLSRLFERRGLPHAQIFFPLHKSRAAVGLFQSHEKGIIRQPGCVFFAESCKRNAVRGTVRCRNSNTRIRAAAALPSLIGLPQEGLPCVIKPGIINGGFAAASSFVVNCLCSLLLCQESLTHKGIRGNEIRVPRKGGKRLVGGIPVARGADRENLPVLLSRFFHKIHKPVGLIGKTSDPVFSGQAEYRQ